MVVSIHLSSNKFVIVVPNTYGSESNIKWGSYMGAYVLLNILNELRKSDKIRGLQSLTSQIVQIKSMLDSIHHMILIKTIL